MTILPDDMDIPLMRRDTSKLDNVRWLVRNLSIRNNQHPDFEEVRLKLLKTHLTQLK